MSPVLTQTQKYKKLSEMVWQSLSKWKGYTTLRAALEADDALHIYLVGGALRDAVLKHDAEPNDFDFILEGASDTTLSKLLKKMASTGVLGRGPLGSPRWLPHGADAYCDVVPIENFNQGFGQCRTIEQALAQFDFSGNALAFDLRTKRLWDTYNGCRDLEKGTIRLIRFDHPETPVATGVKLTWRTVVWFRLLQYSERFHLKFDTDTECWIQNNLDCEVMKSEYREFFNASFWNTNSRAEDFGVPKAA